MRFASVVLAVLLVGCGTGPGGRGTSALIDAARDGDVPTIRSLLAHGADPDERGGVNGWTALLHAIHKSQLHSVEELLRGGATINFSMPDGTTALAMAAGYGQTDIIRVLLAAGADPYRTLQDGTTVLDLAVAGVPDIDRFTLVRCQTETVQLIRQVAP